MGYTQHEMEFDGKTWHILCGKDAKSNDNLLDMAGPQDMWFHIADQPSGHVILFVEENEQLKKIPRQVLKRCACICKATIKASKHCEIIYTRRENVKKTDVLGCVTTKNTKSIVL